MTYECKLNPRKGTAQGQSRKIIFPEGDAEAKKKATSLAQDTAIENAEANARKAILALMNEPCKAECPAKTLIQPKPPKGDKPKGKEPKEDKGYMEAYGEAPWEASVLCLAKTTLEKLIDKAGSGSGECKVVDNSQDVDITGKGDTPDAAKTDADKKATDVASKAKQLMDATIANCMTQCPLVVSLWIDDRKDPTNATETHKPYYSKVKGRLTAIYGCLPRSALAKVGDFLKENGLIEPPDQQKWFGSSPSGSGKSGR